LAEGDCLAFARFDEDELIVVAVNRANQPARGLRMDLRDLPWMPAALDRLDGATAWILDRDILVFDLPAKGTAVLHGVPTVG
jgi:hypothetical protein